MQRISKKEVKIIQLRFREVNRDIFNAIKNGSKKVETRAATKKYKDIKAGSKLILICGKDKFEKSIKSVKKFKTISALTKAYKIKDINPLVKNVTELEKIYYSFPGYKEKIKQFGLIALELE